MSIEFENENFTSAYNMPGAEVKTGSKFGNWLVNAGIAKDAASANVIMIILALLVFASSIYFFIFGFNLPSFSEPIPPEDLDSMMYDPAV